MKKKLIALSLLLYGAGTLAAQNAKYVFYFIGDGMGMGHVNTTECYNRDVLGNEDPILMMRFPIASQVRTFSHNHKITDSAAAGTALSTGHKTNNGMIGMGPDTTNVYSVAKTLSDKGFGIGVASTVAGDDATPAAFYGHAENRGMKYVLAPQAAESGYQFLGGPVWRGSKDEDGKPNGWIELMKKNGYSVFNGYEDFTKAGGNTGVKALLLSSNPQGDQVGFTIDSIPGALTAKQITQACLSQLETVSPDKFFMMVEGGNIDWAAHSNDGGTVIKEILNYQEAINVAYEFYLAHPEETLIVVTADHDTGGMAFGRHDNQKKGDLGLIDFQKISKDRFQDYFRAKIADGSAASFSWDEMKKFLNENLGFWGAVKVTEKDENVLKEAFDKTFRKNEGDNHKTLYNSFNGFTERVFDLMNRSTGIAFTSGYHTANFVPLYAVGAGSELFKGNVNNIEIPKLILRATGNCCGKGCKK